MKKTIVKDWVAYSLLAVNILLIMVMAGDCESMYWFILSKIGAGILFILNSIVIIKYSRLGD